MKVTRVAWFATAGPAALAHPALCDRTHRIALPASKTETSDGASSTGHGADVDVHTPVDGNADGPLALTARLGGHCRCAAVPLPDCVQVALK
jgi:hypothetical protein